MTRVLHLLAPAVLLSALVANAEGMRVCLEDRANIGAPARAGLLQELHNLFPKLDVQLYGEGCSNVALSDVRLTVLREREGIPSDALGLAYRGKGVILPRLEVFVNPVVELTNVGDWETLGRALARVAAHELLHFLEQREEHDDHGLMQARLSAAELMSDEPRPQLAAALFRN